MTGGDKSNNWKENTQQPTRQCADDDDDDGEKEDEDKDEENDE